MKMRWIVLTAALAIAVAAWAAVAVAYFFFDPSITLWTILVTIAAFATEGLFWVGAGVLGWSVLAGRRAKLAALKRRFFGGKQARTE